jgi:hypothetical protein
MCAASWPSLLLRLRGTNYLIPKGWAGTVTLARHIPPLAMLQTAYRRRSPVPTFRRAARPAPSWLADPATRLTPGQPAHAKPVRDATYMLIGECSPGGACVVGTIFKDFQQQQSWSIISCQGDQSYSFSMYRETSFPQASGRFHVFCIHDMLIKRCSYNYWIIGCGHDHSSDKV